MRRADRWLGVIAALLPALAGAPDAAAQKQGGILKLYGNDSPASVSILEEADYFAQRPTMGIFNNLVMYNQSVKQSSIESIVPDLATGWTWNEDGTELTLPLHQGVKWHDGKPFTAKDVKCTWDLLMGIGNEKLRINPRKSWYRNVEEVRVNGDYEVTFRLKRAQPAFLTSLASGSSAIYPCHVPPAQMRQHPIGTGPFKFVEFKPNEDIKVTRNPDYWKPGRPYLDGIEYTIIKNMSTAILTFVAGKVDMTMPYTLSVPLLKDVQKQVPQAICELTPSGINRDLIVNRDKPPFDNAELRRAMALSIDRKAFIDIISEGKGDIGGVMQPLPEGLWGMPPEILRALPGYDPDVQKNRTEARGIMQKLGYGPDKRLAFKVSTRDIPAFRDSAVILIDQLKEVYIDAELETVDTTNWLPKRIRKDYTIGVDLLSGSGDPDQIFLSIYGCGGAFNHDGYCNPQVDELIERQSIEPDQQKRKQLVWEIERKLAEDGARPIIFYNRGGSCWQPYVKNLTIMVNSIFDGNRMEDVWLDK